MYRGEGPSNNINTDDETTFYTLRLPGGWIEKSPNIGNSGWNDSADDPDVDINEMSERLKNLELSDKLQAEIITILKKQIDSLTSRLLMFLDSELPEIEILTDEEIRRIILDEISMCGNEAIYPSDIAFKHNLSVDDVERIMDCLVAEGILR